MIVNKKMILKDGAGAARAVLTVRRTENGWRILLPKEIRVVALSLEGRIVLLQGTEAFPLLPQTGDLSVLCERGEEPLFATTRTGEAATFAKWQLIEAAKVPTRPYAEAQTALRNVECNETHHACEASTSCRQGRYETNAECGRNSAPHPATSSAARHIMLAKQVHHVAEGDTKGIAASGRNMSEASLADAECGMRNAELRMAPCDDDRSEECGIVREGSSTDEASFSNAECGIRNSELSEDPRQTIEEKEAATDPLARAKSRIAEGEPFDLFREVMPNAVWAKVQREECSFLVGIHRDGDVERVLYGIAGRRAYPPDEDRLWSFFPIENDEEGYYLTEGDFN